MRSPKRRSPKLPETRSRHVPCPSCMGKGCTYCEGFGTVPFEFHLCGICGNYVMETHFDWDYNVCWDCITLIRKGQKEER